MRNNVRATDRSSAMVFNSFTFAVFLPVVLLVYYRLAHRLQNLWLLAAGIVFYGWWDWRFLGLLGATTVLDYIASHRIYAGRNPAVRKAWLLASLTGTLVAALANGTAVPLAAVIAACGVAAFVTHHVGGRRLAVSPSPG